MLAAVHSFPVTTVMVRTKSGLRMGTEQEHACRQGAVLAICGRVHGVRPVSKAQKLQCS